MEVKGINCVNSPKLSYSKQASFQGAGLDNIKKAFKEVITDTAVNDAPLWMIPEPIHFAGTYITMLANDLCNIAKNALPVAKEAAFKTGVRIAPAGMVDEPLLASRILLSKVLASGVSKVVGTYREAHDNGLIIGEKLAKKLKKNQ